MKSSSPSLTFIVVPRVAVGCFVGGLFGRGGEGGEVSVLGWCLSHCKKVARRATSQEVTEGHATLLNRSAQRHLTLGKLGISTSKKLKRGHAGTFWGGSDVKKKKKKKKNMLQRGKDMS